MATEKRDLIDRGRLLRDPYFQEGRYPESHLLRMAIREQPDVHAVEVVRCKDCRFSDIFKCGRWCDNHEHYTGDDDFCSDGERRVDS